MVIGIGLPPTTAPFPNTLSSVHLWTPTRGLKTSLYTTHVHREGDAAGSLGLIWSRTGWRHSFGPSRAALP